MRTFAIVLLLVLIEAAAAPAENAETVLPSSRPIICGSDDAPTLSVNGRAEVSTTPDRAEIRLGVVARAPEAAIAQDEVTTRVAAAVETIRALGVPARDIQTARLTLDPIYDSDRLARVQGEAPRIVAYRAANTLRIALDDLTKLGTVVDAGVKVGVNQIEGVSFTLRDDLAQRTQALQDAVRMARTKAEAMASALDVTLDGIAEASESVVDTHAPFYRGGVGLAGVESVTAVQPGEVRVTASVSLRYRIRPREHASTGGG